jgi:hypothetical protein
MQVTLTFRERITTELDVQDVTWVTAAAQQVGMAKLRIPRNHPAFRGDYISKDRGSHVRLSDQAIGTWNGLVVRTKFNDESVELTCHDVRTMFAGLPVGRMSFQLATAGTIVQHAFWQAVAGRPRIGITAGTFVESAPLMAEFNLERQAFGEVVKSMMGVTSQEWEIDANNRFHWVARAGTIRSEPLIQGRDIFGVTWETGALGRVSEVIGVRSDNSEISVLANEMADGGWWSAQQLVSGSDGDDIETAALRTLERERHPQPTVDAELAEHLWGTIREGDTMRLVIPSAGFRGESPVVRIMSRTWSGSSGRLSVQMDVLPEQTTGVL